MSKNPFPHHICRRKPDILPSTFPRPIRHASTILGLSRRLYNMKHSLINRLIHLTNSSYTDNLHYLRSLRIQTRSNINTSYLYQPRMTKWVPSTISHIRRTCIHQSKVIKKGRTRTLSSWFQANIITFMSLFINEILVKPYITLSKLNYK